MKLFLLERFPSVAALENNDMYITYGNRIGQKSGMAQQKKNDIRQKAMEMV